MKGKEAVDKTYWLQFNKGMEDFQNESLCAKEKTKLRKKLRKRKNYAKEKSTQKKKLQNRKSEERYHA